jgi:NADH:ubiquinone oxidoreductase subunit 2 (subunit N)
VTYATECDVGLGLGGTKSATILAVYDQRELLLACYGVKISQVSAAFYCQWHMCLFISADANTRTHC